MKNSIERRVVIPFMIIALLLALGACGDKKKNIGQVPLGTATKGTLFLDLYEEGEVEAVNSVDIMSPTVSWRYSNLKINWIVKDGQEVGVGDTMIMFDPSVIQQEIIDSEASLEISIAELNKMEAQHKSELEELRADYEISEIGHEISKIRLESSPYESEIKKREIQLNLEKADIALARAKEQIDNRIKIQKEEIKQKKLSIKQKELQLQEAHEAVDRLTVTTKSPGIALIRKNPSNGNKFQLSDQIWRNTPMIELPDMSRMKAIVSINEVDISKIVEGLEVEIRPDAFSETVFKGRVSSVANLAINKQGSSKIKVFPVVIQIDGENKELLPGLTVSCRIIVDKIEDVLYIPITAIHEENGKSYVYTKSGSGYNKTEVETGINNSDYIVITKGLKEKETIALVNPYLQESTESDKEETTK